MRAGEEHTDESRAKIQASTTESMQSKWSSAWGLRRKLESKRRKIETLTANLRIENERLVILEQEYTEAMRRDREVHAAFLEEIDRELEGRNGRTA